MKVSELVEMLSDVDQDREVIVEGFGLHGEWEPIGVDTDEDGDRKFCVINLGES